MNLTAHHRVNQYLPSHPVDSWLEYAYLMDGVTFGKKSLPCSTVPVRSTPGFGEWLLPCALDPPLTAPTLPSIRPPSADPSMMRKLDQARERVLPNPPGVVMGTERI